MGERPAKHCPVLTPVAASTAPAQGSASHVLVPLHSLFWWPKCHFFDMCLKNSEATSQILPLKEGHKTGGIMQALRSLTMSSPSFHN